MRFVQRDYQVVDSKGKSHIFTVGRELDSGVGFYQLDGKWVGARGNWGWQFTRSNRQIRDKILSDEMERVAFGEIVPRVLDSLGDEG